MELLELHQDIKKLIKNILKMDGHLYLVIPKYGGQGMPKTVSAFFDEMLSASLSFKLYSELSIGAYNCINHHAPEEIKDKYLTKNG